VSHKTSSLENATDKGPWYEGTAGERIAVRLSSTNTNGAYAIVESVAAPGCSPPMHLHRNEEEHFVVLAGTYRILIEDKVFDAPVGTSVTVPRGSRHSWRNISNIEFGRIAIRSDSSEDIDVQVRETSQNCGPSSIGNHLYRADPCPTKRYGRSTNSPAA
jgi:quercetin dioxygenase-like cupin family protein